MPKNLLLAALNDTAKDLSPTFFFVLSLYFYTAETNLEFAIASLVIGLLLGFGKYLSRRLDRPVTTTSASGKGSISMQTTKELDSSKKKNYN